MEYLVESHMGGYYVSSLEPEIITQYCETCGDSDSIILSWEEGNMMKALIDYFSSPKITKEKIDEDRNYGITKPKAIENILYSYEKDIYLIDNLFEEQIINGEEQKALIKLTIQSRKSQISLICETYPKDVKVLRKKKNKKL